MRLGIANQQIVVRVIELPRIEDEKQREAAVRFQAAEAIAMPLNEAILDHQVAGYAEAADGTPRMQVVLVAARRSMVESLLEAVRGAGLKPDGVDLDAFALVRTLVSGGDGGDESARVFCHLAGVTNLAIAVGSSCFFTRPLSAVWDEPDAGSRLADEIRLSIDYYMTQPQAQRVGEVVLSGPGSGDEELVESLGVHLGLPLRWPGRSAGSTRPASPPMRIPIATPLRRASRSERRHETRQPASPDQRRRPHGRARRQLLRGRRRLGALLLMVVGYVLVTNQATSRTNDADAARAEANTLEQEAALKADFSSFAQIKQQRIASVGSVAGNRFDWERFMRELARIMPERSWIQTADASVTGDPTQTGPTTTAGATGVATSPTAKLVGCTPEQTDTATLMVRLGQLYRVSDVKLNESSVESVGGARRPRGPSTSAGTTTSTTSPSPSVRPRPRPRCRVEPRACPHPSEVDRDPLGARPQDPRALIPLVVLAGYWFLLLSPKREEASKAGDEMSQQQARLDSAKTAAASAKNAESAFRSDFTEVVRLGKAIPASVDMPSLIVALDRAAAGTGIRFTKIATGERDASTPAPATTTTTPPSTGRGFLGHAGRRRRRDRAECPRHRRGVREQRAGHVQPERHRSRAVRRQHLRHPDVDHPLVPPTRPPARLPPPPPPVSRPCRSSWSSSATSSTSPTSSTGSSASSAWPTGTSS